LIEVEAIVQHAGGRGIEQRICHDSLQIKQSKPTLCVRADDHPQRCASTLTACARGWTYVLLVADTDLLQ
jgi:hypothetical protein